MNERMVKRGIIPAALAVLCALMPVLPWFSVDFYLDKVTASPWQIGRVMGLLSEFGGGEFKAVTVIVILLFVFITLLVLCDILPALCEFIDLDLNERIPIINVIAVAGYGLEFLLALAVMIAVVAINAKVGAGIIGFTAWTVFALLFSGCGIAIKIINKDFSSLGAKKTVRNSADAITPPVKDVERTQAVGAEETLVMGREENKGGAAIDYKARAHAASTTGSVEMDVRYSDFKKRYPNYMAFGKGRFAVDPRKPKTRMGDYLFAAGAYPFAVRREYAQVGMHVEASGTPGDVIGSIRAGSVVYAGGRVGEWALCNYQGRYGWIRMKYLVQVRK